GRRTRMGRAARGSEGARGSQRNTGSWFASTDAAGSPHSSRTLPRRNPVLSRGDRASASLVTATGPQQAGAVGVADMLGAYVRFTWRVPYTHGASRSAATRRTLWAPMDGQSAGMCSQGASHSSFEAVSLGGRTALNAHAGVRCIGETSVLALASSLLESDVGGYGNGAERHAPRNLQSHPTGHAGDSRLASR